MIWPFPLTRLAIAAQQIFRSSRELFFQWAAPTAFWSGGLDWPAISPASLIPSARDCSPGNREVLPCRNKNATLRLESVVNATPTASPLELMPVPSDRTNSEGREICSSPDCELHRAAV